MSMSHAFNDAFNKKKNARWWYQKAKHVTGAQNYQELEAEVYWHVLEQKLKDNPLLIAFKAVLAPGGVATSEQLDDCIREDKLSEAENANELIQLTNGLIGLAHYKNVGTRNARVRFIAGILEACYIAMDANDVDKMNHWNTIKNILESVKDSDLSNTWAIADQARSLVGVSQSLTHYKTQLVAAVTTVEQIILKEQVIQTKQAIKDDLKKLNRSMKQIPTLLPRFIYNLYAATPVMTLDYHFLYLDQPEHMTSLVTVGIQQIIGLHNPPYNLCYAQGELNERGTKINILNSIIKTLGGKNEVKMDGSTSTVPNSDDSVTFLKTLRDRTQNGRLVLGSEGTITIFDTPLDERNHPIALYQFPSGFSPEILYADKGKNSPQDAQQRRQQVVLDYVDMLTLIQELQHCLQLNTHYAHYLNQVGELGAFAMTDPTLHEQMESHNQEVAQTLQTKIESILMAFAVPVESALESNNVATGGAGNLRRQAMREARKVIKNTKRKVAAILQHAEAISLKRKQVMQRMKDNKISYHSSLQRLVQQFNDFRRLQNLLGRKEVLGLSPDAITAMSHMAERLDDAIRPPKTHSTAGVHALFAAATEQPDATARLTVKEEEVKSVPVSLWTYHEEEKTENTKNTMKKKWHCVDASKFKMAGQRLRYYDATQSEEEVWPGSWTKVPVS